jgi:hypothetical protein
VNLCLATLQAPQADDYVAKPNFYSYYTSKFPSIRQKSEDPHLKYEYPCAKKTKQSYWLQPIEIDAICIRRALSKEEIERRKRETYCFEYVLPDHIASLYYKGKGQKKL